MIKKMSEREFQEKRNEMVPKKLKEEKEPFVINVEGERIICYNVNWKMKKEGKSIIFPEFNKIFKDIEEICGYNPEIKGFKQFKINE